MSAAPCYAIGHHSFGNGGGTFESNPLKSGIDSSAVQLGMPFFHASVDRSTRPAAISSFNWSIVNGPFCCPPTATK